MWDVRFHLVEQQRAAQDTAHNAFVQKLSNGVAVALDDILGYKHLSKEDIIDHPEEWKYAPVLVSTNIQRLNVCQMKAQMWAKEHKTHVFKW